MGEKIRYYQRGKTVYQLLSVTPDDNTTWYELKSGDKTIFVGKKIFKEEFDERDRPEDENGQ